MTTKIYTAFAGGLGDLLCNYLLENGDCGFYPVIKTKHPDSKIRMIIASNNPGCEFLLSHNPYISDIVFLPLTKKWQADVARWTADYRPLGEIYSKEELAYQRPDIYLSKQEQEQAQQLTEMGSYVAIQLTSGTPDRHIQFADEIYDQLRNRGLRLVFLGSSKDRVRVPDAIDLTKKNTRLQTWMAMRASLFLGCQSCYCVAAGFSGVPSIIVTPDCYRTEYQGDGLLGLLRQKGVNVVYFSEQGTLAARLAGIGLRTL